MNPENTPTEKELNAPAPTPKYRAPKWNKNTCYLVWDNAKQGSSFNKSKHKLAQIKK
jgi:hypothetical protein